MSSLVSIVIPLYKSAERFEKTLQAILDQTYEPIEILLVDDGSPDNTGEIAARWVAEHANIRYFRKENGGVGSARNYGIKQARGEFVAFCDHDDLWVPTKLEEQIPLFANARVGLVYGGARLISIPKQTDYGTYCHYAEGHCYRELLLKNALASSSAVIRKRCLDAVGGFSETADMQGVDEWHLWLRIARDYEVAAVHKPLITLVLTGENYSSNHLRMLKAEVCCLKDIFRMFPAKSPEEKRLHREALSQSYWRCGADLLWSKQYTAACKCLATGWKYTPFDPRFASLFLATRIPESVRPLLRKLHPGKERRTVSPLPPEAEEHAAE
jgi:glycosyltransferase involved in cell wall biosynthesis